MPRRHPALVVLSTLFPSAPEPVAGIFIKERMFRVAKHLPVTVVAPQPWFPLMSWVRRWRPHYRPQRPLFEVMDGIEVHRPRFFALPGLFRRFDGFSIALATHGLLRRLRAEGRADALDVHFGYPDGYAGHLLARWLKLPYMVTLRGKEDRLRSSPPLRMRMARALRDANKVVAVSSALREVAVELGARDEDAILIGNGIDLDKFHPLPRAKARARLRIPEDARVLVSVGGLVERKGFHRVIECLPELLKAHPTLMLLIVGAAGPEGDYSPQLRQMIDGLGLQSQVRFLGGLPPHELKVPLSAADVFVLATRYEGWANVFLEAMACGLPVVSTQVGGNAQVVCRPELGTLVPFGDQLALTEAIDQSLRLPWDRDAILRYAAENTWDQRIDQLLRTIGQLDRASGLTNRAVRNPAG
jgi:glycosyltransferase involved in cell wall biosynthesis